MTELLEATGIMLPAREDMAPGAVLLRGRALVLEADILSALASVTAAAPFRHMTTPGGYVMSAAMTNCGAAGWVTDRTGYRYAAVDPETGQPWPAMPESFRRLANEAAADAGYAGFMPDSCLINRYLPGARLSLHQDKDERDFTQPIVSVSLGLPATFQFGGRRRADPVARYPLRHGDIAVWGGPSRLFHHGVLAIKEGGHARLGRQRINLTFRAAL
ncbi:MAG: DNA oxidative demethylase AlkB [Proteobacteria bacterium]|nr:DNA oxidative demethylase AlkB [Pseudomonadota bacterium]